MVSRRKRDEKLELDSGIDTGKKKSCFFSSVFLESCLFFVLCTQREKGESVKIFLESA